MNTAQNRILKGAPEQRNPYKVEKMADSRWLLHFKKEINGQRITVELTRCTTSKMQKAMWKEKTAKKYVPSTYWDVKVEAYDQSENCHSWYNPTVKYARYDETITYRSLRNWNNPTAETRKHTDCLINFDWLLEATASNAQKILAEIEKMATEGIKTLC